MGGGGGRGEDGKREGKGGEGAGGGGGGRGGEEGGERGGGGEGGGGRGGGGGEGREGEKIKTLSCSGGILKPPFAPPCFGRRFSTRDFGSESASHRNLSIQVDSKSAEH